MAANPARNELSPGWAASYRLLRIGEEKFRAVSSQWRNGPDLSIQKLIAACPGAASARWRLRSRAGRWRVPRPRSTRGHENANTQQHDYPNDDPGLGHVEQIGAKRESNDQDDES